MPESSENMQMLMKFNRKVENLWRALQNSTDSLELCRSRKIVKDAPTLAIGGVHSAENEPPKVHKTQIKKLYPGQVNLWRLSRLRRLS